MPDDKSPNDTSIPPPLDPFPTYQTPYPRSSKDEPNPFIQFRRFADEQFSSFFNGFPNLFGLSSGGDTTRWKREVEDLMRQRHEWEEGLRKQFEQEVEEMRQQLEKSKNDAWKAMDDAWKPPKENTDATRGDPWWTRGKAASCPALNGTELQRSAEKCPALYDETGNPRTELDVYDAIQESKDNKQIQVFQTPAQDTTKKPLTSWFSALGWDGKQLEKETNNKIANADYPPAVAEKRHPRPTTYSMWSARRMSPFDDTNDTIPWLMLSPYSPIYLCNPSQSRLFRVRIQDSENAPLQISKAKFFERWYTDVDEKMAQQVPWADAFEDLLSLQQTGKMVERNYSTWRTPGTWIHDMVGRGSLGQRWGFNEDGMLVKKTEEAKQIEASATMKDRCRWHKERRWGRGKPAEEPKEPPSLEMSEKEKDFVDDLVDKVTEPLAPFPLFGSILSAADAIVSAIDQVQKEGQEALKEATESEYAQLEEDSDSSSYSTSSSSSSSYSYGNTFSSSTTDDPSKSIISTLTTTVTRTLPDGSVETKRVLKRRFADGSEESDESVEVKNQPSSVDRQTQTQTRELVPKPTNSSEFQQPWHDQNQEPTVQQTAPRSPLSVSSTPRESQQEVKLDPPNKPPESEQQQGGQRFDGQNQKHERRRGGGWFWT